MLDGRGAIWLTSTASCSRKGRQPVTPTDGAGAVPAGGGSSLPLPGGPGIDPAGITTGARGASLKRDAKGGNACALHRVKRGLDRASAHGRGERRGGAPKGERVPLNARPRPKRIRMATSAAWRGPTRQSRLFGAPPPFIFLRQKIRGFGRQASDAGASRERERFSFRPPRSGGGGPLELAQRANRGGGGA